MKLSKTVRWILAVSTSIAVFSFEVFAAVNMRLDNTSMLVVCVIVAVLSGVMLAPLLVLHGKRFVVFMAVLFIVTCLFPPCYTYDGEGAHSRKSAGYHFIIDPPPPQSTDETSGVQIDFGRLFLEWAALAAVTGIVWVLAVKPAWSRGDKASRPQNLTPPPGNPEN